MNTRSLYVLDSLLTSWTGVGVYTLDKQGTPQPVSGFQPLNTLFNFYEVSVVPGQGSWWLPTTLSTLAPQQWLDSYGGTEDLSVTGTVIPTQAGGHRIVRPVNMFWWIAEATLGGNLQVVPAQTAGTVSGPSPSLEPAQPPGPPGPPVPPADPSMTVEFTSTGARLVFKRGRLPSVLELDVEQNPSGGGHGG
jgi:hypothetical protein